jgi:hypothetical protein
MRRSIRRSVMIFVFASVSISVSGARPDTTFVNGPPNADLLSGLASVYTRRKKSVASSDQRDTDSERQFP